MNWLSVFITANLIGIGSNFDNCGTGIAYGSEKIKFPHSINILVNAIGFCTALLGAYMGQVISRYITLTEAGWAACVVLVCIGLFFWYAKYLHPRLSRKSEQIRIQQLGWKQGIILGFGLSFTNVAVGFGATVAHTSTVWVTALSIGIWGYILIWLGNAVGIGILARLLGKYSSFFAGLLLIIIGIHEIVGLPLLH